MDKSQQDMKQQTGFLFHNKSSILAFPNTEIVLFLFQLMYKANNRYECYTSITGKWCWIRQTGIRHHSFISHVIGCKAINNSEIFYGVHKFTGKTVIIIYLYVDSHSKCQNQECGLTIYLCRKLYWLECTQLIHDY